MSDFPRTDVGGVSCSRLIIGTNWMLGFSHTSKAWDTWIKGYQTTERLAEVLTVFLEAGVDTLMAPPNEKMIEAIRMTEDRAGRKMILVMTPLFSIHPEGPKKQADNLPQMMWPAEAFDMCAELGASICMPHAACTDVLADRMHGVIRDLPKYTEMIRERGMVPGLSTHSPNTPTLCSSNGYDVETYIQVYNASGFLMHVEADWAMRVINSAEKPCMCIKPLAAGRLIPPVGLAFVWNTIRDQDMVVLGTCLPDEAREVIDISLDYINRRVPTVELQATRSKAELRQFAKVD